MAAIMRKMAKNLFSETSTANNQQMDDDFEIVRAGHLTLGLKKRKTKAIPPGLTKYEERVLSKAKSRAHRMDHLFSAYRFKFGLSTILGIVPLYSFPRSWVRNMLTSL